MDAKGVDAVLTDLRSDDVRVQNEGVAAAIGLGGVVVPDLLKLLDEPGAHRGQIMYALCRIADGRATEAFLAALKDVNESVRAYAAVGLARIGDVRALAACLQTLNDAADELHLDYTPAVDALGEMGLPASPFLLDRLMDPDEMTRLHSQRALELILMKRYGFIAGRGFPDKAAEERARAAWVDHGNYDYDNELVVRTESVAALRKWMDTFRSAGKS